MTRKSNGLAVAPTPKPNEQMNPRPSSLLERYPVLRPCETELCAAFDLLAAAFRNGNKLLVCGNGGSAADSEHIVAELMKGFLKRRPIPVEHVAQLEPAGSAGKKCPIRSGNHPLPPGIVAPLE